jgi:hypothetical protein
VPADGYVEVSRAKSSPATIFSPAAVGGTGSGASGERGGGCLSTAPKSRAKAGSRKAGFSTPGSAPGRRLISFGSMDVPGSAAPERKARYTLPGGKPAFSPGWNAEPDVTDPENEEGDAKGDSVSFSLDLDGRSIVADAAVLLSSSGEASLRLPTAARFNPRRSKLVCVLAGEDGARVATACTEPHGDENEWVRIPGGKRDVRSLAVDVPGFTICFDAAASSPARDEDEATDGHGGAAEADEGGAEHEEEGQAQEAGSKSLMKYDLIAVRVVRQGPLPVARSASA